MHSTIEIYSTRWIKGSFASLIAYVSIFLKNRSSGSADFAMDSKACNVMSGLYESGKAFVPFVKAKLFQTLAEHEPLVAQKPRDSSLPKGMTAEHKNIINNAKPADDRSKPKEGSMYLAYAEDDECWYEAVVVKVEADGSLTMRWRDSA